MFRGTKTHPNLLALLVKRPVAVTLLTFGVLVAGFCAYLKLPVALLPQVDYPTISISATMPGASPNTMATRVAAPLERHLSVIADVAEITSISMIGSTRITVQFGINRNINGAARDVQAAINAAHADLPTGLKQNPTYRKVNPADAPIAILEMTSHILTRGQVYDAAATVIQQGLSQIDGIGQVTVNGIALPAVRVEVNPLALAKYGVGFEDVRAALASINVQSPKGAIEDTNRRFQIYTNDQANRAADYRPLVIAYRNGAPVRLTDVGEVRDSIGDLRGQSLANGTPGILVSLYRRSGANIIDTLHRVRAVLPQLMSSIPPTIDVKLAFDRTRTIQASLHEVQVSLLITIFLVTLVVFVFLRDPRGAFVLSITVPASLIGTFGVMYLLGYTLNNFSMMALIVATGFVVDDAIVVVENITQHIEAGMSRMQATLQGTRDVAFTVVAMSLSLVAVFLPVLLMGGILGRLFREFAVTLSVAIAISLVVSLTTTPTMCASLLGKKRENQVGNLEPTSKRAFLTVLNFYAQSLHWTLRWPTPVILSLLATMCLTAYLFMIIPKGFIPQQDNGLIDGGIFGDPNISFQLMEKKLAEVVDVIRHDPAVESVAGFTGTGQTNSGYLYVILRPMSERYVSTQEVIDRLSEKLDDEIEGVRAAPHTNIHCGGTTLRRLTPGRISPKKIYRKCRC